MKKLHTKASDSNRVTKRETENRKIAYQAALEGIVLLENDGTLPIKPCKIALFGAGASHTIKGGTGSGEVNERHSVTILEGLEKSGFEISTRPWLDDYAEAFRQAEKEYGDAIAKRLRRLDWISIVNPAPFRYPSGREITAADIAQSGTDTCVYVIARQSGECADRDPKQGDYALSELEVKNIKTVASAYAKTIVVINSGSSMDLGHLNGIDGVNSVVFFCQQGCEGGAALADILSGNVSPSGKLAATWAKSYSDIPFGDEYSIVSGRELEADYKEGIYVGYRYFDSFGVEPMYPFGYGLSYTEFAVKESSVEVQGTTVKVGAQVTNTGNSKGKEVVQLYVSCPATRLDREFQSLAAFAKTQILATGETQELTLSFDLSQLAAYDEKSSQFLLESGEYILRLGSHSRDTAVCAVLELDEDVTISRNKPICPMQSPIEELKRGQTEPELISGDVKRIKMDVSSFKMQEFVYKVPEISASPAVAAIVNKLTTDDMVELVTGTGLFGGKPHLNVPGAGAYTTSALLDKGLCNIALCDGPAGLRLRKTSAVTKSGAVKMVDAQLGVMNYLPKLMKKFLFGDPKKDKLIYQFATAFPVGNALAQTWNTEMLEMVGSAVGREMEEYGVAIWLAPGMNIQRNPLCGRNFEYFSEDPLISGRMAAAITRGVQKHEGCFVTLKHFACNNQEVQRQRMSSNVGERALREIYLRGFEIAVKESAPRCVMTSYNRLNGVYTPNSYDLCTTVLRNEWGFDGLVMTDWLSTWKKMKLGDSAIALSIGNDLIMPGGKSFKKDIHAGLKDGRVSAEDLKRCCANIVAAILDSRTQKEFKAGIAPK